ncbi:MAG: hypothetical protein O7H39_12325 [Gammaproteobacteria bacterium]|nr:hypothetical protein [Gammaproteobacteria bacterium]
MLNIGGEAWLVIGTGADPRNSQLFDPKGRHYTFEELEAAAPDWIDAELKPDVLRSKSERAQRALETLAAVIRDAALDVLIVIGDDQNEHILSNNRPGILIYHGPTIPNTTVPDGAALPPGYREAIPKYYEPDVDCDYPVAVELAEHIINYLMDAHFDLASSDALPMARAEGHAFQFVHRRLIDGTLPIVPVMLNTYNAPTQPRVARCYQLGQRIREAVEAYPGPMRVGVLASGGLTHFVIDEDFDRAVLDLLQAGDRDGICALPEVAFQSGTSEIKNWIATAAACEGFDFELIDYVPGYRSRARTGTAMGFAKWTPVSGAL